MSYNQILIKILVMYKNYVNPKTGENSTLPWSPEAALEAGESRWLDCNGCLRCASENRGSGPKARYVKDDSCSYCFAVDGHLIFNAWLQGDPGRPEQWSTDVQTSVNLGLNFYYDSTQIICNGGPHFRRLSIATGRCLDCLTDKASKRGPRAIARAAGHKTYTPISACPSCGQVAERYVTTNACLGCSRNSSPRAIARKAGAKTYISAEACPICNQVTERDVMTNACCSCAQDGRRSASQIFAQENPDYIMDREIAKIMGFTLFRTGDSCKRGHRAWRYVSTGNCVECLR